jgi:hypothetical protein
MTQQLLLEHQKQNDDKTKQMFSDYHKYIKDSVSAYHNSYYEPLLREHNNLQTDFDTNKMNNYAIPQPYLNNNELNPLSDNYDDSNPNPKFNPWSDTYDDELPTPNPNLDPWGDDTINNMKDPAIPHPDDINTILASDNADKFSPPPFDNFLTDHFNYTNLKKDFEIESVDEQQPKDDKQQPKDDSVLEVVMLPQYLSKVNKVENLRYINKTYKLNINSKDLNVGLFKDKIKKKLIELNPGKDASSIIVNLPANRLSDKQIAEGKKITKKK